MTYKATSEKPVQTGSWNKLVRTMGIFRSERTALQNGEAVTRAYAENLSHRLPLLYCVALFNTAVLMMSFRSVAPAILAFWLPLPFVVVGCLRAFYWLPQNVIRRTKDVLARDIKQLSTIGTAISLVPMCWSIALYRFGSQSQQSLIHYITAVTCFTGILSLGQAPRTASRMAVVVMMPTSIFFLMQDHPNRIEVVSVQIVITLLLLLITAGYHADFVRLENSRQQLLLREKESVELAEINRLIASRDSLTGSNNRRAILEILQSRLLDSSTVRPWLAIVDLDGFKHINDTYGHAAGDAVLRAVSLRIEAVQDIEAFGRLGGDEFAILISGDLDLATISTALDSLSRTICLPIHVDDLSLSVRGSIGLHHCNTADVAECMERADTALYKAKQACGGTVVRFTEADERAMCERRDAIQVFMSADLGRQLSLVYQPIVDADLGRPVAFEALVRWSPDGTNWLPPAAFINLAETTGRKGELTRHVLVKALDECRVWNRSCSLAINLSARDILRDNAADWIGEIVATAGAPPRSIILEVTETALLSDYRRAADSLERLRQSGFRIALDDFGTGQSSLSHVHNLPLDHLKIDQSFARDLVKSEGARAIVSTILTLARQLRLDCTIEGIETLEQQAVARSLGVRMMQGYRFGRPMKAAETISGLELMQ